MSYFPYPHCEGTDVTYPFKHLLDASDKNFKLKTPNLKKPNLKNEFKNVSSQTMFVTSYFRNTYIIINRVERVRTFIITYQLKQRQRCIKNIF